MPRPSILQPIPGWSAERLLGIAQFLNLDCNGPKPQALVGKPYVGWSCSGAIDSDDPDSIVTLDFMGIDEHRILSLSGQIHSSPITLDFPGTCRAIVGFILAATDPVIGEPASEWLNRALGNQEVGTLDVEGVSFDFVLHHDPGLAFDIHSSGF